MSRGCVDPLSNNPDPIPGELSNNTDPSYSIKSKICSSLSGSTITISTHWLHADYRQQK